VNTLARIARSDVRTISKLASAGIVVKAGRGKYRVLESLGNMIVYYRERAAGREAVDGSVDVVKSSAGLKDSQRRLNELRIAQVEGALINMEEIEEAWSAVVNSTKQLILGMPARIRFDLPHLTGKDQEIIDRTVRDMLEETALTGAPRMPPLRRELVDATEG